MRRIRAHQVVENLAPLELGETLEFLRLIWAIDHGLQLASKRTEALLGVTGLQRLTLRILGRYPGLSAGQLAGLLHIDPSTLSGVLARLADRDLIDRRPDPRDTRRAQLALSAEGRKLDVATEGTVESAVEHALACPIGVHGFEPPCSTRQSPQTTIPSSRNSAGDRAHEMKPSNWSNEG